MGTYQMQRAPDPAQGFNPVATQRVSQSPSRRLKVVIAGVAGGVSSVAAVGFAIGVWLARDAALEQALHDANVLVRVFEEQTAASLDAAELALKSVARTVAHAERSSAGKHATEEQLRETAQLLPFLHSIIHLDATGDTVHQSDPRADLPGNLSNRSYFQFHREHDGDDLHVGDPVLSRRSGGYVLPVSRRLQSPDPAFGGVLVAAMDLPYLEALYGSVEARYGRSVLLVRRDGIILVRAPALTSVLAQPLRDTAIFEEHFRRAEVGTFRTTKTADGIPRLFSYRAVRGRPLVVLLGLNEPDVLSAWHRQALLSAVAAITLIAAVIAFSVIAFRALSRREESLVTLRANEDLLRSLWRASAASATSLLAAQRITRLGSWEVDLRDVNDLSANPIRCSDETFRIFGKEPTKAEVSREAFLSVVHPDDRASLERAVRNAIESGVNIDIQYRIVLPHGGVTVVRSRSAVSVDAAGVPQKLVGTIQDVTEQVALESGLRAAQARLKALSDQLLQVQETERASLARELHDEFGQTLTTIKLQLQMAAGHMPSTTLEDCIALTEEGLRQVRSLSLALRPPQLDDLGLRAALEAETARLTRQAGTPIRFECADDVPRLTGARGAGCFRIAQEAMTNALRHARAKEIRVRLSRQDSYLCLEVMDDGIGFDPAAMRARAAQGASLGLLSMEERVQILGGAFEIISAANAGACVRALIPATPGGDV